MAQKVVISLISDAQEFQQVLAEEARKAARAAGLEAEVVFAESNAILQIHQLFRYVHAPEVERPVALIVQTVVGGGGERVARAAAKVGIGWILVNREVDYLDDLRREHPKLPIFALSADHREIGRIQGRQIKTLLPGGGAVLYVKGPPEASSAIQRHEGIEEVLKGSKIDLRVLHADWSGTSAERGVVSWLRLKPVDVRGIVAQNDAMAMAARGALVAARPECEHIPVIGCDGLPQGGQRFVREGQMAATVVIPPATGPAIEMLTRVLRAGPMPPVLTRLQPMPVPAEGALGRSTH
jgi:ABC-type sugar transport system substrate-binding protein